MYISGWSSFKRLSHLKWKKIWLYNMFKEVFEKLAFFVLRVKRVEIFKAHLRVKKACSHSFSFKDMFESWEQRHSQRWTDDKEVWWITDFVRNKGHKWRLYRVVSFLLDELIKATWTWKRLQTKQMVLVFKKRESLAIAANFFGSHLSAPTCHPNFHLLFLPLPFCLLFHSSTFHVFLATVRWMLWWNTQRVTQSRLVQH